MLMLTKANRSLRCVVIFLSLLQRLETFPKISNKEWKKLRELGDLLVELMRKESEGVLLSLSCLDTARGIASIAQKLTFSLKISGWLWAKRSNNNTEFPFLPFLYLLTASYNKPECGTILVLPEYSRNADFHLSSQNGCFSWEVDSWWSSRSEFCPIHKKPLPFNMSWIHREIHWRPEDLFEAERDSF